MQLQRVLALAGVALMGCAFSTSAAWDFSEMESSISDEDRSANDEDRIYGGSEADATKYPFTASLRKTADGTTYCGGTLVASQYIVTAAHCVKNTTYVSLNSQYNSGTKDGERYLVTDAWIHPKYVKDTHVYDVAVMKLEKPSTIKPLALCKADGTQNEVGTVAVVRGWGVTQSTQVSQTLLEVNVNIISNTICNKSYNNRITEQMICAGEGNNKDTCQGDSGGALIADDALVGIVSWGGECGKAPGVYVRVTAVLDFINEKIGGGSSTTPAATSAAPEASTLAPSTAPATTSAAPAATTAAPAATTAAPTVTTVAPAATTAAPAATTAAPTVTSKAPSSSSSSSSNAASDATPVAPSPITPPSSGKGKDASTKKASKTKKKKDCGVRL